MCIFKPAVTDTFITMDQMTVVQKLKDVKQVSFSPLSDTLDTMEEV